MYFGMEGLRDFACIAAEVDKEATGGYSIQLESLLRQPLGNFLHICGRWPESLAELLRREPLVEACGMRIVLLGDELIELLLARRIAPQQQQDVIQRERIRHAALIDCSARM
jgi:hypothetical protein